MENATKALLIAAAILIAILVISLGLVAYNMAAQQMQSADFSEAEMAEFNGKFQAYEGSNKTANDVNAMLNTVLTHNSKEHQEGGSQLVEVKLNNGSSTEIILGTGSTVNSVNRVGTGYYSIVCEQSAGLVNKIIVTKK